MPSLFDPVTIGATVAPNRILMAPLTRSRATRSAVPTPLMAQYYAQRASAGLIVSEATAISRQGLGWPYAPGIWSEDQVAGWRVVTRAVHEAGGRIFCQLWHMGRMVAPQFLDGRRSVSASATIAPGLAHTYDGKRAYARARALSLTGIRNVVNEYRQAARHAVLAGFDGVEIHGANGYLVDQFLRSSANRRRDRYGGEIGNRINFLLETTEAVVEEIGRDRTGVRLSPNGAYYGVNDDEPEKLFVAAAAALSSLGIAFLEIREPRPEDTFAKPDRPPIHPLIRKAFQGVLVLNSGYDGRSAQDALSRREADAISFGRPFISNPDLPERLRSGKPLATRDITTWYTQGAAGYTDYPALA
ncbi:alkene reductase [Mesorhizobium sp. CA8]|uniref:alkene reductase n=1 Tax=unclassified Mesorhizobium TaxID=325217 RepID=UPI001CCC9FE8|nr:MULTISPECIES: alkene reductase [unclassified Mesorhizobium]MBZ9761691.1 alkene reductase [Mesorhizobium sp. CA8]MBZ9820555.1 alkene reductase [Mesorhizobium sp. CA4]